MISAPSSVEQRPLKLLLNLKPMSTRRDSSRYITYLYVFESVYGCRRRGRANIRHTEVLHVFLKNSYNLILK